LNRPEKKNAMNPTMHYEMRDILGQLSEEDETRVLILTGAGDAFCGGQDLKEFFADTHDKPLEAEKVSKAAMDWGDMLRMFPKPTVASVNGWTFGGGLRVMCACDLAIASEKAVFGLSEINFGIFPSGGSTKLPGELLSHRDFLYMALTGEQIDAVTADRWRLVNRVVPHDKLKEETLALAQKLAKKNPIAVRLAKEVFWASKEMPYTQCVAWELAKSAQLECLQKGEWVHKGIDKFVKGEYRPGFESYLDEG
jgi:trans-feruloyl-CoA hydratase/vanillin synthase